MKFTQKTLIVLLLMLFVCQAMVFASSTSNSDAQQIGQKIQNTVISIAQPIGWALIFLAVAMISIRLIVMHYNPQARTSSMEGLLWIAVGALLLGSISLVASLLKSIGT